MFDRGEWVEIVGLVVIGILGYAVVAWALERFRPKNTDRGQRADRRSDVSTGGGPSDMLTCPNPGCRSPNQPYAEFCSRCGSRLDRSV